MKLNNSYCKIYDNSIYKLSKHKHNNIGSDKFSENNRTNNINTHRPAQAISFGGSAVSMGEAFIKSKPINSLINFVNDNEAAYNAIYSLVIAGIVKPIFVMKTSGSDEKDKQIIATKNFLQAFIGSFLSLTIGGGFLKKAIDVIKNNLELITVSDSGKTLGCLDSADEKALEVAKSVLIKEKSGLSAKVKNAQQSFSQGKGFFNSLKYLFKKVEYVPQEQEIKDKAAYLVNNLKTRHFDIFKKHPEFVASIKEGGSKKDAFESFWKNSTGWITAIGKAKIASLLLPTFMAAIFAKRNMELKMQQQQKSSTLSQSAVFRNEQEKYRTLMNQNPNKTPSFTGSFLNSAIDSFAHGVESLAMTKAGKGAVGALSSLPKPLNKPSARMADLDSFMLTAYWVVNTSRSKKIEPSQKLGLNVHTVLVTLVSSLTAFLIDTLLDGLITKESNVYKDTLTNILEQAKEEARSLDPSAIEALVKDKCKNLIGSQRIAKEFSKIDLNSANLKDMAGKFAKDYGKKLSKFKSLTVFTFVVRFLVPVLMVKPSGKLKNKIQKYMEDKNKRKTQSK